MKIIMEKIALVTGSSSGIGLETSLALARDGFYTFATMRDIGKGEKIKECIKKEDLNIEILELDVDDEESVNKTIKTILEKKDRIDVLVNNAGYGMWGTVEDVSVGDFKKQFETNFFSIIRLIQKVAPIMRKQNYGNIVNISSVAGRIGFPVSYAYIISNFALVKFKFICFGPLLSAVINGKLMSVCFELDNSHLAFSAVSLKRCNAIGSLPRSMPSDLLNSPIR